MGSTAIEVELVSDEEFHDDDDVSLNMVSDGSDDEIVQDPESMIKSTPHEREDYIRQDISLSTIQTRDLSANTASIIKQINGLRRQNWKICFLKWKSCT